MKKKVPPLLKGLAISKVSKKSQKLRKVEVQGLTMHVALHSLIILPFYIFAHNLFTRHFAFELLLILYNNYSIYFDVVNNNNNNSLLIYVFLK